MRMQWQILSTPDIHVEEADKLFLMHLVTGHYAGQDKS
jgi:hypothetical protein